jgi:sec-independent protein translocase protein TatC
MKKRSADSLSFWEHVEELRRRAIVAALCVTAGSVAGYLLFPWFVNMIYQAVGEQLYAFAVTEGFLVRLKTAVSLGVFISLPVIVGEIALFVLPALTPREKVTLIVLLVSAFTLFAGGLAFAFQGVLPITVQFLRSPEFFPDNVSRLISFRDFLDFFMTFLVGFGVCFQFPIVMLLALKFNVLPLRFFTRHFKVVVILIFVLAAVITPPDVVSQIALALPLLALYSLTLLLAKILGLGTAVRESRSGARRPAPRKKRITRSGRGDD